MEDEINQMTEENVTTVTTNPENSIPVKEKIKKWDHIAIRPKTFEAFRNVRGDKYPSDGAFIEALLQNYLTHETNKGNEQFN